MSAKKATRKPAKRSTRTSSKGLTAEEKAAMREAVRERKAGKADGESDLLAKVAEMPKADRVMAERVHAIVKAAAPGLVPRTWYGMPAYAKDGKVICFFRADKYMTFGLSENANHALDEGTPHQLRESAWFFNAIDDATEAKLSAIVRKAAS